MDHGGPARSFPHRGGVALAALVLSVTGASCGSPAATLYNTYVYEGAGGSTGTSSDAGASGDAAGEAAAHPDASGDARANALPDAGSDASVGVPADAASPPPDAAATGDATGGPSDAPSAPPPPVDAGTNLAFGKVCGANGQCSTGLCLTWGDGALHCTEWCSDTLACPPGLHGPNCNGKGYCE